eukprot:CAMPEP_0177548520 /NCGR_PEP_ID=MMETSP0369-20130122/64497_1 /TAXON_ID=447022 ORGANISM="Scrippsiella hangoei-like, Strain SHHI-4" /NCGR_SAMPLE_ID=MMETSP0369 /ASSEMBLY_ACC=CAM_ASM_000364 /LENGTH=41 /DNA_ID= /DNA_START= /DNA_END= /DNA_ORIENTATION=
MALVAAASSREHFPDSNLSMRAHSNWTRPGLDPPFIEWDFP